MAKKSSRFASNVLKLAMGSAFAQGLVIISAPVLTRLFAPEAFALAAVFASMTSILRVLSCFRYEMSIVLPKDDDEAANLLGLSLCMVLLVTGLSGVLIFFAGDFFVQMLHSEELEQYLWLIPVLTFVNGFFLAMNYWYTRQQRFGQLSVARVVSSILAQGGKVGLGFAGYVSGGVLIVTSFVGNLISMCFLGGQMWRTDRALLQRTIRWDRILSGLKRYKKFPLITLWSVFLNSVSRESAIWVLAYFFASPVVGFYEICRRVLGVPAHLIGQSIGQVFFQRAAQVKQQDGELGKVVENVFKRLVALGMFPFFFLACHGRDIFTVLFGKQWDEAGVYMQILSVSIFFSFVVSPLSQVFSILERQGRSLIFNSVFFVVPTAAMVMGGLMGNELVALGLFAGLRAALYFWLCLWIFLNVGASTGRCIYYFCKYGAYCGGILGLTIPARYWLGVGPWGILALGCLGGIVYYVLILREDRELKDFMRNAFQRFGFTQEES